MEYLIYWTHIGAFLTGKNQKTRFPISTDVFIKKNIVF